MARSATEIAELLAAGKCSVIPADFDDVMKSNLRPERLRRLWRLMRIVKGKYVGISGGETETTRDGFRVVDLPLHYRSDAKLRVTYRSDGRIAGLFILYPEVP